MVELRTEYLLTARRIDGTEVAVSVRIEAGGVDPATIVVEGPGWTDRIKGVDFYRCMMNLRERLEADGYLLCVEGARPDVTPSGGLRQMTDGRMAYRLRSDALVSDEDMVDIFASTDCGDVVSISEQLEAITKNLRGHQN